MATSSAAFAINGGASGGKASVAAAGSVTATLSSIANVRSVVWTISGTDETTNAGMYTLIQSGSVGQTVTCTALTAGTAAILQATINGGQDSQTGQVNFNTTRATGKFFVPTTTTNLEVGCAGENYESDPTYGSSGIVNAAVRAAGSGGGGSGAVPATPNTLLLRDGSGNGNLVQANAASFASSASNPATAGLLRGNTNAAHVSARNAANSGNLSLLSTLATDDLVLGDANTTSVQIGAGFLQFGLAASNPATAGSVRLISGSRVMSRNNANSANVSNIASSSTDDVLVGDTAAGASVQLQAKTAGFVAVTFNSVETGRFVTGALQFGAAPSTAGTIRLQSGNSILSRNAAATANVFNVATDGSDNVLLGDNTNATSVQIGAKTAGFISASINSVETARFGAGFLQFGAAPAASGAIRLGNNTSVVGRNSGATADISLIGTAGNDVAVGDAGNGSSVQLQAKSGGFASVRVGGTETHRFDATQFLLTASQVNFAASVTPAIAQVQAASGVGVTSSWYAQQGFSGSVGGVLKIGGGGGGVPGTQLAGATQIDNGALVSNISAKTSFLGGGVSYLDINQTGSNECTAASVIGKLAFSVPANTSWFSFRTAGVEWLQIQDGSTAFIFATKAVNVGGSANVNIQSQSVTRATFDANGVLFASQRRDAINAAAWGSTTVFDFNLGAVQTVTLTGNITTLTLSNLKAGGDYTLSFIQGGAGGFTVAAPATMKLAGGAFGAASATGKRDTYCFWSDGTNLYEKSRSLNV